MVQAGIVQAGMVQARMVLAGMVQAVVVQAVMVLAFAGTTPCTHLPPPLHTFASILASNCWRASLQQGL